MHSFRLYSSRRGREEMIHAISSAVAGGGTGEMLGGLLK